jgi:hypothetical protein
MTKSSNTESMNEIANTPIGVDGGKVVSSMVETDAGDEMCWRKL